MTDFATAQGVVSARSALPSSQNPQATSDASDDLLPGFDDPVTGAQRTFRALLDALAHPGALYTLDAAATRTALPPSMSGLSATMTAVLLTLVDSDTALWLPDGVAESTRRFLRFHCGCSLVQDPASARFVAVPLGFEAPALSLCDQGDPAYPDRSTTMLIDVSVLQSNAEYGAHGVSDTGDAASAVILYGPGIEHTQTLHVRGLPAAFWTQWRANHRHFPLGVDAFLCSDTAICGLPRTTRLED